MTMPTSCWTERLMAYFDPSAMGWMIQAVAEIEGARTPK